MMVRLPVQVVWLRADHAPDDDASGRGFRGFAQNSPRGDYSPRTGPAVKLRHQAIAFVSAGSNTPAELEVDETVLEVGMDGEESDDEDDRDVGMDDDDDDVDDRAIQTNIVMDAEVEMSAMKIASPVEPPEEPPAFFVDTAGDNALAAGARPNARRPPIRVRSPSPAPSDSSEEVVVFHGRGKGLSRSVNGQAKATQTARTSPAPSRQRSPHITDDLLAVLCASDTPSPSRAAKGWAAAPAQPEAPSSPAWTPAPTVTYWRKTKATPDLDSPKRELAALGDNPAGAAKVMFSEPAREEEGEEEEEEDKDAETTIAELQADWKQVLKEKRNGKAVARSLDEVQEPELVLGKKPNRRSKRGRKKSNRQLRIPTAADEDEDDEEAAYDDYMQNLAAQLSGEDGEVPAVSATFNPMAGPSLVINGREIPENAVFKHDSSGEWEDESSSEGEGLIGQDYDDVVSPNSGELNDSDLDSSDLERELEDEEREAWEDEEDLRQRRQERMTDEQIARLLAKQEELGILDDDIVLDDGFFNDSGDDEDGIGDLAAARIGLRDLTHSSFATPRGSSNRQRQRSKRHGDFSFPSASLLADTVEQYGENGFDIMDLDRPSLRPAKKGRKGRLPAELDALSDDELRDSLHAAWAKDRDKKRVRKLEREGLRREGLLSSAGKTGKADLGEKYLEGMTMRQVQDELRLFLQSAQQSRPFPPMAKEERRVLHQVADKLRLKSKSVGSGKNRFPVLYKTRFTVAYEEEQLGRICRSASRGFLQNSSSAVKTSAKVRGARGRNARGGFDRSAVSLRNGEVVGADAKELGKENFGHRLMEKMGWQAGTALGKDGEGLLVPVAQVMRSGKAGLG